MSQSDSTAKSLAEQLIDDISALWRLWSRDDTAKVQRGIAAYFLANRRIIEDMLHVLYEQHTSEERRALLAEDPALDKIAIPYAFYETASRVIWDLPDSIRAGSIKFGEDDFTMLLRALEFARALDTKRVKGSLRRSPAAVHLASASELCLNRFLAACFHRGR